MAFRARECPAEQRISIDFGAQAVVQIVQPLAFYVVTVTAGLGPAQSTWDSFFRATPIQLFLTVTAVGSPSDVVVLLLTWPVVAAG